MRAEKEISCGQETYQMIILKLRVIIYGIVETIGSTLAKNFCKSIVSEPHCCSQCLVEGHFLPAP